MTVAAPAARGPEGRSQRHTGVSAMLFIAPGQQQQQQSHLQNDVQYDHVPPLLAANGGVAQVAMASSSSSSRESWSAATVAGRDVEEGEQGRGGIVLLREHAPSGEGGGGGEASAPGHLQGAETDIESR